MMDTDLTLDVLTFARYYASRGWRVIPIAPGAKYPVGFGQWQNQATTDVGVVDAWWTTSYPGHGVGIATGAESGVFVVDIDGEAGRAVLAQWVAQHGPLPATVEMVTGSGDGAHLVFRHPGERVRTRRGTPGDALIPVGIDVRGDGGQIVAPPSTHASGGRYRFRQFHEPWNHDVADAPTWLLDLVCDRPVPGLSELMSTPTVLDRPTGIVLASPTYGNDESPAAHFNRTHRLDELLVRYGWVEVERRGSESRWKRPGKTDAGHSAVLHDDDHPVLVVFSTDAPAALMQRQFETSAGDAWRFDAFELWAAMEYGGDKSRAASEHRASMPGVVRNPYTTSTGNLYAVPAPAPADDDDAIEFVDWRALADDDGGDEDVIVEGFVHAGRWTAINAAAKQGKSTLVLAVTVALTTGREPFTMNRIDASDVLYIDREMTRYDMRDRIEAMGVDLATLDRFHYTETVTGLDTPTGQARFLAVVERIRPRVVIIDGVNGVVGGAENEDGPWRALFSGIIVPLKLRRIAVVTVDNTGKDPLKGPRGHSTKLDKPDVVLNLTRTDNGTQATATHRRTARFPQSTTLVTSLVDDDGGPLDFVRKEGGTGSWPEGTATLAIELDRLGVALDASKRTARNATGKAGVKARDVTLRAALKYRKAREERSRSVQPPVTESAESGTVPPPKRVEPGTRFHDDRFGF